MDARRGLSRWLVSCAVCSILATGCGSTGPAGAGVANPTAAGAAAAPGTSLGTSASLGASPGSPSPSPGPSAPASPHLKLVAIGDSLDQGKAASCPGCTDYVDLFAEDVAKATGRPVDVDNRSAIELSALPAIESGPLLNDILSNDSLRAAIAGADIVIVNVGFNDTPWNRVDNPCDASNLEATVVDWSRITPGCIARVSNEYAQTLDQILNQIDELRGCFTPPGQPADFCAAVGKNTTMLRVMTVYDDWIGEPGSGTAGRASTEAADRAFVATQCWVASFHGGLCADEYHALNGPLGTVDAAPFLVSDHTHLSQAGHQKVAEVLAALGYAPLK
jgi:lysophospholipase L1-like esterase